MPEDTDGPYVVGASGHRLCVGSAGERAQELVRAGGTSASSRRLRDAVLALAPWDVVVHIGADDGETVVGADARTISFGSNSRVLLFLRRSMKVSEGSIDLREVALGAKEGEARFVVDTVVVPCRTLDAGPTPGPDYSACVKIDVEGAEFDVLAGARSLTAGSRAWAIIIEVLHMDPFEKARLATDYTMRVMDRRTGDLVVVPPASPQRVAELLDSAWLHSQDAVLTARDAA
ncbi:hypothetical protein EUA06_00500 [Nocardioides glacieisoli]|uniref:Methyltransferase FkbM domain-containing protein n=1 Tax=Nocardioides glacieisoli TaxID=1168730 RepID=A0A4Q2S6A3_9ACTN|nr:FkbM family methyltransferase [Nocardioides glacieisoli]RYB96104.1 hypothetical protein EUA06_00500 [Nocardioides glacieisoli]